MRLSQISGFVPEGDVIGVDRAIATGRHPTLVNRTPWEAPRWLQTGDAAETVVVTDELLRFEADVAFLRPPSLVFGVHPGLDATPDDLEIAVTATLAGAGLARSSVALLATHDVFRNDKCVRRFGLPIRSYEPRRLDRMPVREPSPALRTIVGAHSVCEAAAKLAAGRGCRVLVARSRSSVGTISIVRRIPVREVVIDVTGAATAAPNVRR